MLRSMIGDLNAVADIIPVDLAANMMIAITWKVGVNKYVQVLWHVQLNCGVVRSIREWFVCSDGMEEEMAVGIIPLV